MIGYPDFIGRFLTSRERAQRRRRPLKDAMGRADRDQSLRIAESESRSRFGGDWFACRLAEMRLDLGDHASVRRLVDDNHRMFGTADGRALLARLLMQEGDPAAAERILLDLVLRGQNPDALRLLRLLPPSAALVDRACAVFLRSQRSPYRKAVQAAHLVELAALAGDLARGAGIADRSLRWLDGAEPENAASDDRDRSGELDTALADFQDLAKGAGDVFLISGTLLGVMRDGRLMGYDKDVDVGVLDAAVIARVTQAAIASFAFSPDISPNISGVKLKHRNGVVVDVFLHHVEGETVWHGGPATVWDNARWWRGDADRFATARYRGRDYLIPSDWDGYLTENYGDWRTPVSSFSATTDAPNRRIADRGLSQLQRRVEFVKLYHRADFRRLLAAMRAYEADFGADRHLAEARRVLLGAAAADVRPLAPAAMNGRASV